MIIKQVSIGLHLKISVMELMFDITIFLFVRGKEKVQVILLTNFYIYRTSDDANYNYSFLLKAIQVVQMNIPL